MTPRQEEILKIFRDSKEPIQMQVIQEKYPRLSRFSINRDLNALIELKAILRRGDTKGASYELNISTKEGIRQELHKAPHLRAPVVFNEAFLSTYEPNKTTFIKSAFIKELQAIGIRPKLDMEHKRWMESALIDLSWASSRFEGSTLSWLETKTLVEYGEGSVKSSDTMGIRHILNHKEAINFILSHKLTISDRDIKDLHSLLSKNLLSKKEYEGSLRQAIVSISGSAYKPLNNPWKIKEAFEIFCQKAGAIKNPFEQAFFVMAVMPYIQPFHDANKRTSRIGMNIPLLNGGYFPFSFLHTDKLEYNEGMAAVYERNHTDILLDCFMDGYQKGSQRYREICEEHPE